MVLLLIIRLFAHQEKSRFSFHIPFHTRSIPQICVCHVCHKAMVKPSCGKIQPSCVVCVCICLCVCLDLQLQNSQQTKEITLIQHNSQSFLVCFHKQFQGVRIRALMSVPPIHTGDHRGAIHTRLLNRSHVCVCRLELRCLKSSPGLPDVEPVCAPLASDIWSQGLSMFLFPWHGRR